MSRPTFNPADPRHKRRLENARLDRQLAEQDREHADRQRERNSKVPRTKDGVRRARLRLDALDTAVDEAYSTASEALDMVQAARERERATATPTADRRRFPTPGSPAKKGRP